MFDGMGWACVRWTREVKGGLAVKGHPVSKECSKSYSGQEEDQANSLKHEPYLILWPMTETHKKQIPP